MTDEQKGLVLEYRKKYRYGTLKTTVLIGFAILVIFTGIMYLLSIDRKPATTEIIFLMLIIAPLFISLGSYLAVYGQWRNEFIKEYPEFSAPQLSAELKKY